MRIKSYKPFVNKKVLYFIAGALWSMVGIMLSGLAFKWAAYGHIAFLLAGLVFGVVIAIFGFSKIALKNIRRIKNKEKEKLCIFGFIAWKSYLLIFIMILMGAGLRHSALPKYYLALIYSAIGSGLFFSSIRYFAEVFN